MNNFDFLVINYNLNQQYFIEKSAIEKVIDYVFGKLTKIVLLEKKVLINEDGSDFEVEVTIRKPKNASVSKTIFTIEEKLNYFLFNLSTYKAKNIQIKIS